MHTVQTSQIPPGLQRGGQGFLFFGEYFNLIKEAQMLCAQDDITEGALFAESRKFSDLYARYKDFSQQETGVDDLYLCSLCAAGCDLIDRRMKTLYVGRMNTGSLEREDEGVER